MAAFATVQQLEARWRPLSPNESDQAEQLLEDAAIIIARYADVDSADVDILSIVSCNMVQRAMSVHKDALGFEGTEPTPLGWTEANPAAPLRIYPNEIALLAGQRGAIVSVRAERGR